MAEAPFTTQMAVVADRNLPGRYTAELTDGWNAPVVPQGGIVTSLALRAMAAELDEPAEALRSVSTVFAAQVRSGPVEIDVTVLRRGRSVSQASATVRSVGEAAGHTSVAVFGRGRPGFSFTELQMPDVPPPEECPSFRDPPPDGVSDDWNDRFRPSFWEAVEGRAGLGHAPWDDYEPTTSQRVYWYRFDHTPRSDDGRVDPLALVTLCDTMPGAVGERLGPRGGLWLAPSADLTVHVLGDAHSDWLIADNRARFAGDGYASADLALWDPADGGRLVAYATQMMFFSFPDGPPPDALPPVR